MHVNKLLDIAKRDVSRAPKGRLRIAHNHGTEQYYHVSEESNMLGRYISKKNYGLKYVDRDSPVFEGLTFAINQGERIALSGKNGCGKSTLIKMILQKSNSDDNHLPVVEEGVCETASGLVISYVGQETTGLKGDITGFCRKHDLNQSLFCGILRQLDRCILTDTT